MAYHTLFWFFWRRYLFLGRAGVCRASCGVQYSAVYVKAAALAAADEATLSINACAILANKRARAYGEYAAVGEK